MLGKLIEVNNNILIRSEVTQGVPEFKELTDIELIHLWAMFDPESPYMNYTEWEIEEKVQEDFPVNKNDLRFIHAFNKCKEMYDSPIRKLLRGAKASVEKLALYLQTTTIEHGRDGNISQIISAQKSLPQIVNAYQATEQAYKSEVEKSRGLARIGIDELDDD